MKPSRRNAVLAAWHIVVAAYAASMAASNLISGSGRLEFVVGWIAICVLALALVVTWAAFVYSGWKERGVGE